MKVPVYSTVDDYLDGTPNGEKETECNVDDAEKLFYLTMPDDSMEPSIKKGEDVLFYETKKSGGSGKVTLTSIGKDYYVRIFDYDKDFLSLIAENPAYERMDFTGFSLNRVKLRAIKVDD